MKKLFTLGVSILLFISFCSNASATIIKSAGTPVAGLDWANTAAWAGGVVPTSTDTVQIVSGDSVAVSTEVSCARLLVDGTFYLNNKFHVNGDIVVSGTFNDKATSLYCYNIYNYGRFWASSAAGSSSSTRGVYMGCGFTLSGTTYTITYPVGDYVLVNDGRFGDFPSRAAANSVAGSGISLFYNTAASSLTIKSSSSSVTPIAFGIAQILPISGLSTTNNFTLNIQENVAVVKYSSSAAFSLQNGDTFTGTRNCNVAAGATLTIAGYLHTRNSTPSVSQAQMNYNIDGTLDLTSLSTGSTTNEVQFYTSATSPNIALNVGATGMVIFGKAVKLTATAAGQTIAINNALGGVVKFGLPTGLTVATPVTLSNVSFPLALNTVTVLSSGLALSYSGTVAQTIDGGGATVTSLTLANTSGGVTLTSPLTVTGALGLSGSNLKLGANNLTVGSISSSSATSYIVTDGAGKLSTTAKTTGTLFPIGTASAYTPMTITPAADVVVAASVSGTATGTYSGYGVNATEWTVTPATATTAGLVLTPSAATYTDSPAIFSGINSGSYVAKTDATVATGAYTASGVALDAVATVLATGGVSTPTAIETNTENGLQVYAFNKAVVLKNAKAGDLITVYGANGAKVLSSVMTSTSATMPLSAGIYMVKVGAKTTKVAVF